MTSHGHDETDTETCMMMMMIRNRGGETTSGCFKDGITSVLSKWNALQMAVHNHWGGPDSDKKSHQLASDILSWFLQSKEESSTSILHVENLESLLHESLLFTFNTEIEDGSIEQVAEQLMILYEEHMQGFNI